MGAARNNAQARAKRATGATALSRQAGRLRQQRAAPHHRWGQRGPRRQCRPHGPASRPADVPLDAGHAPASSRSCSANTGALNAKLKFRHSNSRDWPSSARLEVAGSQTDHQRRRLLTAGDDLAMPSALRSGGVMVHRGWCHPSCGQRRRCHRGCSAPRELARAISGDSATSTGSASKGSGMPKA